MIDMDKVLKTAIATLQNNKQRWAQQIDSQTRIAWLQEILALAGKTADEWISRDLHTRQVDMQSWDRVTSVLGGPYPVLRMVRNYIQSLRGDIPLHFLKSYPNGQLRLLVYPQDLYERVMLMGLTGEVVFAKGVDEQHLMLPLPTGGKVALVLGAGNISAITATDALHQLFSENNVVLIKIHPVVSYLGDILTKIFDPLITRGFVQIVQGDAQVGEFLCRQETIEAIHITGSIKTYQAIVQATEGKKTVTAELGNVTPVIVVPGPWNSKDIATQSEHIACGLALNGGFNCISYRILIQQAGNPIFDPLRQALRAALRKLSSNPAYYPRAEELLKDIAAQYSDVECIGAFEDRKTPWMVLSGRDSCNKDDRFFREEIFGSFMAEATIKAKTIPEYIDRAVGFCNETLWGTLGAVLIVHPASLKDHAIQEAVERAILNLRYGTVCVNQFPGLSYGLSVLPWGAFDNKESGVGKVHNPWMLNGVEKSVLRAPFHMWPKPMWYPSNKSGTTIAHLALEFEKERALWPFLKLVARASLNQPFS